MNAMINILVGILAGIGLINVISFGSILVSSWQSPIDAVLGAVGTLLGAVLIVAPIALWWEVTA